MAYLRNAPVVSPGLRSRPSLSVLAARPVRHAREDVSPGLRSRPSLSDAKASTSSGPTNSVAGATVPAFVERP